MIGTGSVNLAGLSLISTNQGPSTTGGLGINTATFISGANGQYFDSYGGFLTVPSNFGSGSGLPPSSASGSLFGVIYQGGPPHNLIVPTGYTSSTQITTSQTFNNTTLATLGLSAGTYSYTWGTGSNADIITVVIGGTSSSGGGGGGATGSGSWYFYSDEGELNAPPPTADGNAIFRINSSPAVETYNPNKANGVSQIYFNLSDSAGIDYTTQFTTLTSGGTITMTQGANTATYTSAIAGTFFVDPVNGIFVIQTGPATQTVTSASPFVSGVPITLSFS